MAGYLNKTNSRQFKTKSLPFPFRKNMEILIRSLQPTQFLVLKSFQKQRMFNPFNPKFFPDSKISKSCVISIPLKQSIIIFRNFYGKVCEKVCFMIGHNCDRWDTVLYQPLGRLNIGLFDLCSVFVCVFLCVCFLVCVCVCVCACLCGL